MSVKTIDVYATTNPALCAYILWSFVAGYIKDDPQGVEYPLIFLPIPIVLSNSLSSTFEGTNVNTGFFNWVIRNPQITVNLANKLEQTSEYTRNALLFAFRYNYLTANQKGHILTKDFNISSTRASKLNAEIRQAGSYAQRLGQWLGQLKSTENAFHSLGLTL